MTEAYRDAGLLDVPRANDDDEIAELERQYDDADWDDAQQFAEQYHARRARGDMLPRQPQLRDDLTTETHIYNPYTIRWIRNTNANRLRILASGGHRDGDMPLGNPPEIIEQRNGFQRRQPGERYVIAGLVMEVVRDVRPWHA